MISSVTSPVNGLFSGNLRSAHAAEPDKEQQKEVERLRARDQEVRNHEQAHAAAGGALAGAPNYRYERGPDGRMYAVEGEVSIDVSPVSGDPQATLRKMQQVKRAALAPAQPSAQDQRVASQADAAAAQARAELAAEQAAKPAADDMTGANARSAFAQAQGASAYQNAATPSLASGTRVNIVACRGCGGGHA